MKVLAIDPGISTGMAWVSDEGELIASVVTDSKSHILQLLQEFAHSDYTVVIEDFVGAGPRTKEAIFVLKLIGFVTAVCLIYEYPLHLQVPQQRLPLLSEAKQRAPKGAIIHAVDAYAHALAYQEKERGYVLSK